MSRLNKQRQEELEPQRMEYALEQLQIRGYVPTHEDKNMLQFTHNGKTVTLWPYSGWFAGKSVTGGRGIHKLLKQLNSNNDEKHKGDQ